MGYLFFQIWVWIIAAFALGWFAHWFLCCRGKEQIESSSDQSVPDQSSSNLSEEPQVSHSDSLDIGAATTVASTVSNVSDGSVGTDSVKTADQWKPQGFLSAPDKVDDLKQIKGIGSVIEKALNELGIYQFEQISSWDNNNISWVEGFLSFPGRINRENWIEQSKTLAAGNETEFSKRVDSGDVDYSS